MNGMQPPPAAPTAIAAAYQRDGYYFPHDVTGATEAAELQADLEAAEAECAGDRMKLSLLRSYPSQLLPSYAALIRHPRLLDPVSQIIGPDLLVWSCGFFIKEPGTRSFVSWHQDLNYWGLDGDDEVTAWVALTPATVETGCMRYVAGSQQLLRADRETVSEVSPAIADDIARVVAAAIGDCGVLVLSDYAKGVLTAPSITAMIAAAHRSWLRLGGVLAEFAVRQKGNGVVSFGIAGDERIPPDPFGPACDIAHEGGLLLVPHAGETMGPESVWAAIKTARPHRLAHGVRSIEDPDLLKYLRDNQIVCDVAPTSNLLLGVAQDIELHQLPKLIDAGVPVTINTDDQTFFGAMLCDEYRLVRDTFGLSDYELAGMARVSALASGAPEATKQRILKGIDAWLESDPDEDAQQ